jgi:hypothetical protein
MIMKGLFSMGAITPVVACLAEKRIASSVLTWPRVMLGSLVHLRGDGLEADRRPAVRTSSWTPVVLALDDQRSADPLVLGVDLRVGPEHVVVDPVL